MKGKIKKLFKFLGSAWSGGPLGKLGIFLSIFGCFMFIGLFQGDASVQRFIVNNWKLQTAYEQRDSEKATLAKIETHLDLLKKNSPDYIEELGLRYLNVGDPEIKILRF